jgi:hypothetical protein
MVDKDGDSLQDMQMYSPTRWSKESGLHSLGGKGVKPSAIKNCFDCL